ncbi:hypothetical protein OVS_02310 [Mycoplasma ovis str. Michigan]|uniref:Uncharacterized protein n=2 Tax=Mycoplasma ovis TaxID=171632 RepID=A0ABM5P1P4_9MOLU|nr:hypothetical protein OVS_02310 [Mycoplasma ovis str. Michigan]
MHKISVTEPILDCNEHGRHYKIHLTAKAGGKWDTNNAKDSIAFYVVDGNGSSLSWGGTKESNKENHWTNWKLRLDSNKVYLQVPSIKDRTFSTTDYQSLTCQTSKISPKTINTGGEVNVTATSSGDSTNVMSFKLEDSSCQVNWRWKECSILFDEKNNLKWMDNFNPKAYF